MLLHIGAQHLIDAAVAHLHDCVSLQRRKLHTSMPSNVQAATTQPTAQLTFSQLKSQAWSLEICLVSVCTACVYTEGQTLVLLKEQGLVFFFE